eukprot:3309229-Amphidinium_carterae.1
MNQLGQRHFPSLGQLLPPTCDMLNMPCRRIMLVWPAPIPGAIPAHGCARRKEVPKHFRMRRSENVTCPGPWSNVRCA